MLDNVGGFKVIPNIIGVVNVINTTAPENVEQEIEESIDYTLWYCSHYLKLTKNDEKIVVFASTKMVAGAT